MNEEMVQRGCTAYEAYCDEVDWISVNGEELPQWDALPSRIQAAWIHAADTVWQQQFETE